MDELARQHAWRRGHGRLTDLADKLKRWDVANTARHNALDKAGLTNVRFHDLRHIWASWHRQTGTRCDELQDLGG